MEEEGLETPEELASAMADRSPADALMYVVDWLDRRDHLSDEIIVEHLAASLEVLAAELGTEAVENLSPETKGLILAATVLLDKADGARTGDEMTKESVSRSVETAEEVQEPLVSGPDRA